MARLGPTVQCSLYAAAPVAGVLSPADSDPTQRTHFNTKTRQIGDQRCRAAARHPITVSGKHV